MARTVAEISQEIKSFFVNNTVLQQAYQITPGTSFDDNFSKVSIEGAIIFIFSYAVWIVEKLMDSHVAWIEKRAKEIIPGNIDWYARISKEFQLGDNLEKINGEWKYATVNEENQIIKLASVSEGGGKILIKVATLEADLPTPLTPSDLDSFATYMNFRKFAGITVLVVSRDPDLLKINYKVYVNALLFNEDGSLISDGSKPVEDAINNYVKDLPFNGLFAYTAMTDKIQAIPGVINPIYESGQAKYGAGEYADLGDFYLPNAGYLKIDEDFPLEGSITYIRQ